MNSGVSGVFTAPLATAAAAACVFAASAGADDDEAASGAGAGLFCADNHGAAASNIRKKRTRRIEFIVSLSEFRLRPVSTPRLENLPHLITGKRNPGLLRAFAANHTPPFIFS